MNYNTLKTSTSEAESILFNVYNLKGKDNIVMFYTNRYPEQPMIIKGAGAGAARHRRLCPFCAGSRHQRRPGSPARSGRRRPCDPAAALS